MTTVATVTAACNSCGNADCEEIGRSRDYEFRTCDNEFVFVRCTACGLVYLKNRPDVSELSTIYPSEYYRYNEVLGPLVTRIRALVQRGRVGPIARYAAPGVLIAEVGFGNGELLRALQTHGDRSWRLVGVDFAPEACDTLSRLGIAARCERFETMAWQGDAPGVIIMNQVIEHLEDPRASVRKAFELLAPGGVLMLETPSTDAWDARWFRERHWGGWHCPRHWYLYEPATLERLLASTGFEIVETSFLLSPYNWLHSLRNAAAERYGWPRLSAAFSERVVPALVLVCALDVLQRALTGRTSNMRMVGRKPAVR